jgi:hypothetical protein
MIYRIDLPYIPKSMNQTDRWHWAKKAKYKKQIEEDIYYLVQEKGIKEKLKFAKVRITYFFPDLRRRDIVDNYNPKCLMDGVVKSGLLEDDRHTFVGVPELVPAYEKGNAHTLIEVWSDTEREENYKCLEELEVTKNRSKKANTQSTVKN